MLQIGSSGGSVLAFQQWLNTNGFTDSLGNPLTEDGRFGRLTEQAVVAFQEAAGIGADGVVGPVTLNAQENYSPPSSSDSVLDDTPEDTPQVDTGSETDGLDQGSVGGDTEYDVIEEIPETDWQGIFVGMMGSIGITETKAQEMWASAETLFTDPNYSIENIYNDLYRKDEEGAWIFPAFMERFPAIETLYDRRAGGESDLYVPSPRDYLAYEKLVQNNLNNYDLGIASGSLVEELLTSGVSETEITDRFAKVDVAINQLPSEVSDVFANWYGEDANRNIAAIFLDPDDSWATGQDGQATWNETGNRVDEVLLASKALQLGDLELTQKRAASIRELGLQESTMWSSFQNIAAAEELFAEKLGEQDFTAEEEGVESAFFGGTEVEKRRQSRVAEFSGGGGAFISGEGTGLGSA